MKVIIAGSRTITDMAIVEQAIAISKFEITEVFSGMAKGVDLLGLEWGHAHGFFVRSYFALWASYGRAAGPMRNQEMADHADALIAIWDGQSKGTRNMIQIAKNMELPHYVHRVEVSP